MASWATDNASEAARPRITTTKVISVTVTASHSGAPRRCRIPVSGWKPMTSTSASRTGAMMAANCLQRQDRDQQPGHAQHDDQATRQHPARFGVDARRGHIPSLRVGAPGATPLLRVIARPREAVPDLCVLAVATAAYLSAVYLVWDARRLNETGRSRRRWHGSGDDGRAAVPRERQFILPR